MDKQDFYKAMKESFRRILDADIVAGEFAEKAGLEKHLKSTRRIAEKFEEGIPEHFRGPFNLLMCYTYKGFAMQPGIARTCIGEANYYLRRAKEYGELSGSKRIGGG